MSTAILDTVATRPLSPFVGRAAELSALRSLADDVRARDPRVVLVSGEAGVGKSRLLAEHTRELADSGALVLVGRCNPVTGADLPHAPWVAALRPVLEQDDTLVQRWPALAALAPASRPPADAPAGRLALFESALALLRHLGSDRPVVVVLDDVHWADPSTVDLAGYLACNLTHEPLLLVLALRPEALTEDQALSRPLAELARLQVASRLDVPALAREDLAVLLESSGSRPTDAEVDALLHRSGGLPFIAEQLAGRDSSGDGTLPVTVRQAVGQALAELDAGTRRLLAVVATAGRAVGLRTVAAAAELTPEAAAEQLEPALRTRVLVTGPETDLIAFRHDLYREIVLSDQSRTRLESLHRRLAEVLSADGRPGELAYHHERAGDPAAALTAAVRAAAEARQHSAVGDAGQYAEQAWRLWDQVTDPGELSGTTRARLAREAASSAWLLGDPAAAATWGARALDELPTGDPGRGTLVADQARYRFNAGQRREALDLLEAADRELGDEPHVLATLAQLQMLSNECGTAVATAGRAARVAAAAGLRLTHLHARSTAASAMQALGQVATGVRALDGLVQEVEHAAASAAPESDGLDELRDPGMVLARVVHNAAYGLVAHGWPRRGLALSERGLAHAARAQLGQGNRANLQGQQALALLALGDHDRASAVLRDLPRLPPSRMSVSALEAQVTAALLAGDHRTAATMLDAAQGADELLTPLPALRAELALLRGRWVDAAEIVADALERMARHELVEYGARLCVLGIEAWTALREAARHDGMPDEAARALAEAKRLEVTATAFRETCRRGGGSVPPDTDAWAAVAVALANGDVEAWREAVAVAAASDLRVVQARTALGLGRALLARRERPEAARVLGEAQLLADGAGAVVLGDAVREVCGAARLDPRRPDAQDGGAGLVGLTAREVEVCGLLVAGLTNAEIGGRLFISTKTASVHVSNILRKLDVGNRRAAAVRATELGIVSGAGAPG